MIELKWSIGKAPEYLHELKRQYEAAHSLMGCFELSGLFSEELMRRVHSLCWRALDVRIRLHKNEYTYEEANDIQKKLNADFRNIFDTYSIFSSDFKTNCLGLYFVITYESN